MYSTIGAVDKTFKSSPVYYKVAFSYEAQGSEELTLRIGDIIEVILVIFLYTFINILLVAG